jgi:hypothetical protein
MRLFLLGFVFLFMIQGQVLAQDNLYSNKSHKRIWKRWRSNRQSYNPYLEKKKRNKPSAILARENKKASRRQELKAKRQVRRMRTGK